jgi:hypothetical protein
MLVPCVQLETYGDSSGRDSFAQAGAVVTAISEKIARAYVELTTEVEVAVTEGEESCGVKIHGCAGAGDEYGCCDLTIGSSAQAIQTDAIAEAAAGAEAKAFTCGDEFATANADALAEAVANAWAKAVSAAQGWCETSKKGTACSWGETSISALAKAQAKALAKAWATADNKCNCKVDVDTTATAFEKIFVKVHTELALEACVKGGKGIDFTIYAQDVKRKTVTASAEAFVEASADHEKCAASAFACASVEAKNKACCTVDAATRTGSERTDAYAEAAALAGALTCGEDVEIDVKAEVTATAIAKAWAAAILDLHQSCESRGKASACSIVDAEVSAWAKAEAKAVASAWAGSAEGCKCSVNVDAAAEKIGTLLVNVVNKIRRKRCVKGASQK